MKVLPVTVQYASKLVNDYLNNFGQVGHLFEHNPMTFESFQDRYEIVLRDYHTDRANLVRILLDYNQKMHCGPATLDNLRKLEQPETTVVITGQQAGVFTGPLYTIYKTITVIQLAEEIARKTGKPVVPVFWVAAEDHDYAEIDHLDLVNNEQEIVRLSLDYTPEGKFSVGHIPVTEAVFALIDKLEANTNPSEWKPEILNKLRQLARDSSNLADWFAAVMVWLFRDFGLVIVNPMNSELRKMWAATFVSFLNNVPKVNEKLQAGMNKVRALGMEPQVETAENNVHMFLYVNGERLPLLWDGDEFTVRGRDTKWSLSQLTEIAQATPERLSPNVVLRPVAQDVLLPIMAYVAGPGEISYYALYREIYPLFNQRMPVIYPRANVTIVERGIAKHLNKYGVDFGQGPDGLRKKLNEYLEAQDRLGIDSLFANYRARLEDSFHELVNVVSEIDPELVKHGSESLNKILYQVEHFEKKAHQFHRKSCDLVIKRFRSMENQLFPRNNWQERVLNIFPYLFKYGADFTGKLTELPLLDDNLHKLIYLGD